MEKNSTGAFADYVVVGKEEVFVVPNTLPLDQASGLIINSSTCYG